MKKIDVIRRVGPFIKGLGKQFAPDIVKGFVINYIKTIPVAVIIKYVEKNESLWGKIPYPNQRQLKDMADNLDNIDFLTSEWFIDAIRDEIPATASLFMSWVKGRNWLDRQLEIIKRELGF